ncbi:MAG: hypothetical protein AB9M60_24140 [Leptothrix sp. (in: b-proteobacteria)]
MRVRFSSAAGGWFWLGAVAIGLAGCAAPDLKTAALPAVKPVAAAPQVPPAYVPAPRTGPAGSTVGAQHGGLVLEDQGVRVELVAHPAELTLYLSEAEQPLSLAGATGHITLLNGVDITDAYLSPAAEPDRLTIVGSYKIVRGTRVIVRATLADGRRLNLRFLIIL